MSPTSPAASPARDPRTAHTTDAASRALEPSVHTAQGVAALHVVASPVAEMVDTCHALDTNLFLIGRDVEGKGLRLPDGRLSRLHARLLWDAHAGAYRLGDARSRNATFVNGRRIESALLQPGDVIRVGDTLLVFGASGTRQRFDEQVERLARSGLHVLVRGETGTGKELLARKLHQSSGRRGELLAVNCASLSRDLVGSELFGHAKGAFSGAAAAHKGLFVAAEHGTLLLDEIGDCPLEVQAALLRVLQEKRIRPVGAEREVAVDVRVVAATHQDLERAVENGTFRADLYARLMQATLRLAPLRERKEDIPGLIRGFLGAPSELPVAVDALEVLLAWHWPLNVRELESLIRAFVVLAGPGVTLRLPYLTEHHPALVRAVGDRQAPEQAGATAASGRDRARIVALLDVHSGNVAEVAREVGKPRAQVYRWMRAMGLSPQRFRK